MAPTRAGSGPVDLADDALLIVGLKTHDFRGDDT
jgi:hypothetical protein